MESLPTLQQLYSTDLANLNAEFGVNISLVKKVALRAYAAVHAGKLWLWYKVLGFVQKNIWVDTADSESRGGTLERFGRTRLGRNPRAAVAGQYTVTLTGSAGAVIPAQRTWKSDDSSLNPGMIFILDAEHTMADVTDTVTLRALTPGLTAKLEVGDTLTYVSPIALVNSKATVTTEAVQPLAAETLEAYRSTTLQSYRIEAQGGSPGDYRLWSLDAQGVLRAYAYAKSGETNAMNVFVEATEDDSTDGKGTPSAGILADVEEVCNFDPDTTLETYERGRRPGTVGLYVLAVTIFEIDVEITGSNFTASQETLITTAIKNMVKEVRPFVAAADVATNKNDILDQNKIIGVIFSQVPGAVFTAVVLKVNNVTYTSYTFIDGNIPWCDTVTFP